MPSNREITPQKLSITTCDCGVHNIKVVLHGVHFSLRLYDDGSWACNWRYTIFPCWVLWGIRMHLQKANGNIWSLKPPTQLILWRRITMQRPYNPGWWMNTLHFISWQWQVLSASFQEEPSDPPRASPSCIFLSHYCIHSSWPLPSLHFQTLHVNLEAEAADKNGEGTMTYFTFSPQWDMHLSVIVPWHHLVHQPRSVTDFTGL